MKVNLIRAEEKIVLVMPLSRREESLGRTVLAPFATTTLDPRRWSLIALPLPIPSSLIAVNPLIAMATAMELAVVAPVVPALLLAISVLLHHSHRLQLPRLL